MDFDFEYKTPMEKLMDQLQPGTEMVIPGFIMASEFGGMTFCGCELPGYMTIAEHTIEFTVPADFNIVAKSVEAMDKQLDALADKYHAEQAKLLDKKNKLLQLGMNAGIVIDEAKGDPE